MKTTKKKSSKKLFLSIITLSLLTITIGCFMGCCTPEVFRQVQEPRDGKVTENNCAVIYSYDYKISIYGLEKLHPFEIRKYEKIYKQLVDDGVLKPEQVFVPETLTEEDILLVHSKDFLKSLEKPSKVARYLEADQTAILPASVMKEKVIAPFRLASGGTLLAGRKALDCGVAINIGGGYHHAKPDKGEGFCIFADIPIAIRKLQKEGKIKRALIIDLDVHQGNGTAVCLENDDSTFTFSMHQGNIYPVPKENSDMDIELNFGEGDEQILPKIEKVLPELFEKAKPDIVFYVAGCDTLNGDPLASLAMTESGIVKRDDMVINACRSRKIPVVMTLAGGYSSNAWRAQYNSIKNILKK